MPEQFGARNVVHAPCPYDGDRVAFRIGHPVLGDACVHIEATLVRVVTATRAARKDLDDENGNGCVVPGLHPGLFSFAPSELCSEVLFFKSLFRQCCAREGSLQRIELRVDLQGLSEILDGGSLISSGVSDQGRVIPQPGIFRA